MCAGDRRHGAARARPPWPGVHVEAKVRIDYPLPERNAYKVMPGARYDAARDLGKNAEEPRKAE